MLLLCHLNAFKHLLKFPSVMQEKNNENGKNLLIFKEKKPIQAFEAILAWRAPFSLRLQDRHSIVVHLSK